MEPCRFLDGGCASTHRVGPSISLACFRHSSGQSEFHPRGEFRRHVRRGVPVLDAPWRIAARCGRVVYSADRADRAEGTRVLETWLVEPTLSHTLLRATRCRRSRRSAGARSWNVDVRRVRPTAWFKWSDLTVDPDGFVWLEPWRPSSMQGAPLAVWVVHPATGTVDAVVIEDGAFPAGS